MQNKEWEELIKDKPPTKITGNGYGFEITFSDGTIVEIGTTTEYDSSCFTFETNWEKKAQREKWDDENKIKEQQRAEFEENKRKIMAKYSPEQWAELEQAFLFNNGMTFEQNKKSREEHNRFIQSMWDKYGTEEAKEFWKKLPELTLKP